jgi:tetratricopeptide (TPR) repeat protein
MTTPRIEGEGYFHFDKLYFEDQLNKVIHSITPDLYRLIRVYALFNIFFLTLGCIELALLVFFFAFLTKSSILAFGLGAIFLTFFSYFILRMYFQSQRPEQLKTILHHFLDRIKEIISYQEGVPEHHIALAGSCCRFSESLENKDTVLYTPPKWLHFLAPTLERFSCWWHWQDIHKMREILLSASIEEYIKLVQCEPTNLEVHVLLANAYHLLSRIYMDPRKEVDPSNDPWIPVEKYSPAFESKFQAITQKAIEELKIISEYTPEDPWVHRQLAANYRELKMPEDEIREYETILKFYPQDQDTLFTLGQLYFQQGRNAKGLKIYEELKRSHYKKAEYLIKLYRA